MAHRAVTVLRLVARAIAVMVGISAVTVLRLVVMAAAVSRSAVVPAVSDRTVSPMTARVTMTRSCPKK